MLVWCVRQAGLASPCLGLGFRVLVHTEIERRDGPSRVLSPKSRAGLFDPQKVVGWGMALLCLVSTLPVRAAMPRLISLAGVKWSCLRINKQAFPP